MTAHAYDLVSDAFGSVAGQSSNAAYALRMTGGLPIAGPAANDMYQMDAGFWTPVSSGVSAVEPEVGPLALPRQTALHHSYPNPFGASPTQVSFQIASDTGAESAARIDVFDITGRRVTTLVDANLAPGHYRASWDGRNDQGAPVGNGVYFARLTTPTYSKSIRIVASR
jgi:hypothetical protein